MSPVERLIQWVPTTPAQVHATVILAVCLVAAAAALVLLIHSLTKHSWRPKRRPE